MASKNRTKNRVNIKAGSKNNIRLLPVVLMNISNVDYLGEATMVNYIFDLILFKT